MSDQETKEKELSAIEQAENALAKRISEKIQGNYAACSYRNSQFFMRLSDEDQARFIEIEAKLVSEVEKYAKVQARREVVNSLTELFEAPMWEAEAKALAKAV